MNQGGARSVVIIQHLAFENLGSFEDEFRAMGYPLTILQAGVDNLSPMQDADIVAILGGPIGVYEEGRYPFLNAELEVLRKRLGKGLPTLGICLGAQLIAKALGASVYSGPQKEIGWSHLSLSSAAADSPLQRLSKIPVLHWHGDTFDLPKDATLLASSDIYANQAFSIGSNILGLQFHAEVKTQNFEQWLIGHACELAHAKIDINGLRAETLRCGPALEIAGRALVRDWIEHLD